MADPPGGQSWKMESARWRERGRGSFLSVIRQPRMMGPNGRRREKGKLSHIPEALNSLGIPAGNKQDTLPLWMDG